MNDPKVRRDGKCVQCGKPRQPERSAKYAQRQADDDPFCSSNCARAFHGVEITQRLQHGPSKQIPVCGTAGGYASGCKCQDCLGYVRRLSANARARTKETV